MRGPFALLALGLLATSAAAQVRHNSSAPIDFNAGTIELQDRANRAILSGGVNVKQANMTLEAQRMTVAYTGRITEGSPQVSRLDASGGVTVTRPNQRAKSQYAVYDLNRRLITMLGGVTLVEGAGNTVSGGRLTINLDSGRATIDGSSVGTTKAPDGTVIRQGGRVTGRFSVPDRTQ
ncbi:LptA/OstA family protein [uncultured Sphingomonas sp.]|uniref:LptA/OstA family protein n=1 Tax=uncultured Sphingomonas sp. TaxID=158754 RepID=UPI0025F2A8A3|nr:LptA/OstA family protein [uncultured Sphingomonas sp.]